MGHGHSSLRRRQTRSRTASKVTFLLQPREGCRRPVATLLGHVSASKAPPPCLALPALLRPSGPEARGCRTRTNRREEAGRAACGERRGSRRPPKPAAILIPPPPRLKKRKHEEYARKRQQNTRVGPALPAPPPPCSPPRRQHRACPAPAPPPPPRRWARARGRCWPDGGSGGSGGGGWRPGNRGESGGGVRPLRAVPLRGGVPGKRGDGGGGPSGVAWDGRAVPGKGGRSLAAPHDPLPGPTAGEGRSRR